MDGPTDSSKEMVRRIVRELKELRDGAETAEHVLDTCQALYPSFVGYVEGIRVAEDLVNEIVDSYWK